MNLKGLAHGSRTLANYRFKEPIHIAVKRPSGVLIPGAGPRSPQQAPMTLVDETVTIQTMEEWFKLVERILTRQVITPVDMGLQAIPQLAKMLGILVEKDEGEVH